MSTSSSKCTTALLSLGFVFLAGTAPGCSATSDAMGGAGTGGTKESSVGAGGAAGEVGFGGGIGGSNTSDIVPQTCDEAVREKSYIGCEYWPTVTSNSLVYSGFEYAIALANPTKSNSDVTVERNGVVVATSTVASGDLQTLKLPWVPELKYAEGNDVTSVLLPGGGYKVSSSVPVTMYQFNPLEFQLASNPPDCPHLADFGACFSFTNDASILLPTTALRGEYYVMSYPAQHAYSFHDSAWVNSMGFVAITATANETKVKFTSTAHVRVGSGVGSLSPGQTGTYTLQAGDVLMLMTDGPPNQETSQPDEPCVNDPLVGMILCPTAPEYDLTGSHIEADKPVSVIGGHDCSFVPYDRAACDHLEESLFPVEALGKDLIVTAPKSVLGSTSDKPDSMYVRVLSAADNNYIEFSPAVGTPGTLNAGHWVEIGPVAKDFRIMATNKILVGQYMVGENFTGVSVGGGDPSLSIAIPTDQYRSSYTFLAPSTYTQSVVNVVAPTGATIELDGQAIPAAEFSTIGTSGMSVARHQIFGGAHAISSDKKFGIVVYGYGSYTSYMYPGGLNLETIIVPH